MNQQYIVAGRREVKTYAYLRSVAKHSLDCGNNDEAESFHQFMSSLMFSAFTLEAYMNHLGDGLIEDRNEIESRRYLDKLKDLYQTCGLEFDNSRRPLQTIIQLVKFRNLMAHGKTENISGTKVIDTPTLDPRVNVVETRWEQFCNARNAHRALHDVCEIVELLHNAAASPDPMLWSFGTGVTFERPNTAP